MKNKLEMYCKAREFCRGDSVPRTGTGELRMLQFFAQFRQLTFSSMVLRMLLAMICGGFIGLEREKQNRPAGFRTYMLTCLGAALTMMISQYIGAMLPIWKTEYGNAQISADVTRLSAQVINGIGFLGAGSILVTGQQEVRGLTTAVCLWSAACLGIAIGSGFLECMLFGFAIILLVMFLKPVERSIIARSRYMNIFVEVDTMSDLGEISTQLKQYGLKVLGMDINQQGEIQSKHPSAVMQLQLVKNMPHAAVISMLAEHDFVASVTEV